MPLHSRHGRRARGAIAGLLILALAGLAAAAYAHVARPGLAHARLAHGPTPTLRQASNTAPLNTALGSARAKVGAPGAEAAVVACGRVLWAGFSGVSDLRSRREVSGRTLFVLASSTKTITATMIMQLVQAGRLSLNTPLSAFYPRLPNASGITVRMLLNMTSGLPEYLDNPRISNIINNDPRHRWTRNEILTGLGPAQFAPGARYRYTNTNFIALGGILERITGTSIEDNFKRRVGRPAGMTSSTFIPTPAGTSRMAQPYTQANNGTLSDWWIPGYGLSNDYWGPVWTDGGLASTATDLARFGNALLRDRLVNAQAVAQMTNAGPNDYGLGIYGQSFDGHWWLGHDGDYGGFESEDWTDRSRQVSIAVTTNLTERDSAPDTASDSIWRAVVGAYDNLARRSRPTLCKSRM
jgi:D-alanyl-D-alanine carboxypeptidase